MTTKTNGTNGANIKLLLDKVNSSILWKVASIFIILLTMVLGWWVIDLRTDLANLRDDIKDVRIEVSDLKTEFANYRVNQTEAIGKVDVKVAKILGYLDGSSRGVSN